MYIIIIIVGNKMNEIWRRHAPRKVSMITLNAEELCKEKESNTHILFESRAK